MAEKFILTDAQFNAAFDGIVAAEAKEMDEAFGELTHQGESIDVYVSAQRHRGRTRRVSGAAMVDSESQYLARRFEKISRKDRTTLSPANRTNLHSIDRAAGAIQSFG